MSDRKDLDWGQTVCPMQALAQHRARIQTLFPQQLQHPAGARLFLFQTGTEHAHTAELHVQVPPLPPLGRISRSAHGVEDIQNLEYLAR